MEFNSTSKCVGPISGVKWFALGGQASNSVDESTERRRQEASHLALRRCNLLGPNLENTLPTEPRGHQEDFLAVRCTPLPLEQKDFPTSGRRQGKDKNWTPLGRAKEQKE